MFDRPFFDDNLDDPDENRKMNQNNLHIFRKLAKFLATSFPKLFPANLADHIDSPFEDINKNPLIPNLILSDQMIDIKGQLKIIPINENNKIHHMLYIRQIKIHLEKVFLV